MVISVNWTPELCEKFAELAICIGLISGITVQKENEPLRRLRKAVFQEVRNAYNVETLKDDPTVSAYRDFYWKLDIDPTKTRPAGEALVRRILHGDELPNISTVVDAYNLASAKTMVPVSGFDRDRVAPPLHVRFARHNENFLGIGMRTPVSLTAKTLVLTDEKQVLCIYPHRDCDHTKITAKTRNLMIVGYGVPGTTSKQLKETVEMALTFIKQVSGGEKGAVEVFWNSSV